MNEVSEKALTQASREKYWEEADDAQKIERLRETVARLCRDVTTLTANLAQVCGHRHGENGELLTPFRPVDPHANYAHDNGIPHNLRTQRERR